MADSVCTEVLCLKAKQISSVYIPYQESRTYLSLIAAIVTANCSTYLELGSVYKALPISVWNFQNDKLLCICSKYN